MEIVLHRANNLLPSKIDPAWGAEIDIRSSGKSLVLAHDPYTHDAPLLEPFLKSWAKRNSQNLLVLNPKEDGIEKEILPLLKKHKIENFFFLDLAFPTLIRLCQKEQEDRVALRVSEYESQQSTAPLIDSVKWVWVDTFSGKPPSEALVRGLKPLFKVCLVSPELQGYPADTIENFLSLRPYIDAVCTKEPKRWT